MVRISFSRVLYSTLFFLLVGEGGFMSFCKILRHIRVMFSTTTGVFILTAIRNRLRAEDSETEHFSAQSVNQLTVIQCATERCSSV